MYNKKGQAAMEFLTTYGWAFLVIIVAVAGLGYFGVFDFSRYQQASFSLDGQLEAGEAFAVDVNDDLVQLQLKNNYAKPYEINSVVIYEKAKTVDDSVCTFSVDGDGNLSSGEKDTVNFNIDGASEDCGIYESAGSKKNFVVKVKHNVGGTSIENIVTGEMTTSVAEIRVSPAPPPGPGPNPQPQPGIEELEKEVLQ